MVLVGRPGYRIDCRTIKGGSRVSSLIVSFVESSNHCILGIIFIGSYLVFLYVRFRVCVRLLVKLKFIENGVRMHHLCVFGVGDFAGSYLREVLFFILLAFILHC